MNHAVFAGRLGKDAVLRTTPQGDSVLGFSVAVDERKGKEKSTLWVACSMWGKRADALAQYMKAGTTVCVSGSISVRTYEGRNGPGVSLELRVSEVSLLGGGQRQQREERGYSEPAHAGQGAADFVDDDIPF